MPRFAANLTLMFTEYAFLDRFAAAADAGFPAVEFLFPYDHPADAIAARLAANRLELALFNLPPGDWAAGERGIAALPDRFAEVIRSVDTGLPYARATGAKRLHLMAGLADRFQPPAGEAYRRALGHVAGRLAEEKIDLLIEPINRRSMPGYFLDDVDAAVGFIAEMQGEGHDNVRLQFDIFHCQVLHGDVSMRLARHLPIIGHVQVASVPTRTEPGTGELDDAFVFAELDRLGYSGLVGCEYNPRAGTEAGLGWFAPYRDAAP